MILSTAANEKRSREPGEGTMLKQILATSALIAIATVSIQSTAAADGSKFRQLVVEPSGAAGGDTDPLLKKNIRGLVRLGSGIQTPGGSGNGGNGNGGGNGQVANFIVAPSQGVPAGNGGGDG